MFFENQMQLWRALKLLKNSGNSLKNLAIQFLSDDCIALLMNELKLYKYNVLSVIEGTDFGPGDPNSYKKWEKAWKQWVWEQKYL